MRHCLPGLMLCATTLVFALSLTLAAEPAKEAGDLYLKGYKAWEEGSRRATEGAKLEAMVKLKEAEAILVEVQMLHPAWHPEVVNYRLSHVRAKLAELVPPVRPLNPLVPQPTPAETKPLMPTIKPAPMYFDRSLVPFEFNGRLYFKTLLTRETADVPVQQR